MIAHIFPQASRRSSFQADLGQAGCITCSHFYSPHGGYHVRHVTLFFVTALLKRCIRIPERIASFVPQGIVDFPQQTTRTAVDLVFTGTLRAHPNVKPILSHSGGTLPYLSDRICGLGADVAALTQGLDKDTMYAFHLICSLISDESTVSSVSDFGRFWFDVAIGSTRYVIPFP